MQINRKYNGSGTPYLVYIWLMDVKSIGHRYICGCALLFPVRHQFINLIKVFLLSLKINIIYNKTYIFQI